MNVLRVVKDSFEAKENEILVGRTFSFDLLDSIEELPSVKMGDNTYPNYVFYAAESLIVFNHIDQHAF